MRKANRKMPLRVESPVLVTAHVSGPEYGYLVIDRHAHKELFRRLSEARHNLWLSRSR